MVYLTPQRFNNITSKFETPNSTVLKSCPDYDEWDFGIEAVKHHGYPPYVGSKPSVPLFLGTGVTYFVGAADNCTNSTSTSTPACNTHDNVGCEIELQGRNRLDRHLYVSAPLGSLHGGRSTTGCSTWPKCSMTGCSTRGS